MNPARILVLIVNHRTAPLTVQAIEAILPEVRARGDAQILVVDNASNDGSAAAIAATIVRLAAADICTLLELDTNLGFAGGNNAGLDHYRRTVAGEERRRWPDYVWLLNPDTIAQPDALSALVDFMEQRPEVGLTGGRCLRSDGTMRPSAFRFHSPMSELLSALDMGPICRLLQRHDVVMPPGDSPFRAEWLSGSHLMIRGSVLERIGPLDAKYFLYFEETDFCARAAAAGFEVWHVPQSRIIHLGGASTGQSEFDQPERRPRYWFESRVRFFARRHGLATTHLANLLWLIAAPIGKLWRVARGRAGHEPPRLWRDFLIYNYGPGGLMYRIARIAG